MKTDQKIFQNFLPLPKKNAAFWLRRGLRLSILSLDDTSMLKPMRKFDAKYERNLNTEYGAIKTFEIEWVENYANYKRIFQTHF